MIESNSRNPLLCAATSTFRDNVNDWRTLKISKLKISKLKTENLKISLSLSLFWEKTDKKLYFWMYRSEF